MSNSVGGTVERGRGNRTTDQDQKVDQLCDGQACAM